MSQVILIENNKPLNDLLSINLQTYVGAELIPKENAEEAIHLLSILPSIDLIICRDEIGEEKSAEKIITFLKEHNSDTGLIVLGKLPASGKDVGIGVDPGPKDWEKVINAAAKILGVTPEKLNKKVLPDYIPMPVRYFLNLETSCCDVFIRIKRGPDDFQFVKRIHNGDTFSKKAIQRYLDQGLTEFYVPKDMQKNFTNFLSDRLVKILEEIPDDATPEEWIENISNSYEVATKEILRMGFNSATVQLTDAIIEGMVRFFEKSPEMSPLLHKVINSKSGYMYQHCHMTSIVASEILNNLGLDNKRTHEIMATAAFFCDISFVDCEDLAKITTYEELEAAELSEEDWDLVFNHAFEASVLIQKHPDAHEEVSEIIKHHHGAMNGKGFSSTNSAKLSGMDKVFFISCEFVKELLAFKEKGGKPAPIVEELYAKYPDPEMKKTIKALEETLKKKVKKK